MSKRATRGQGEENGRMAVPEVRPRPMRRVPPVRLDDRVLRSVELGKGEKRAPGTAWAEDEALELTANFSRNLGVPAEESRPCIAVLFYSGVGSGAKPAAFIIALELAVLGFSSPEIKKALESFSAHCAKPLGANHIASVLSSVAKDINSHRYACLKLQSWCPGEAICPWKKGSSASLTLGRQSGPSAFVALGWQAYLKPSLTSVFLALVGLRIQMGRAPDKPVSFFFAQLELRSGLSRGHLREHLEALHKVGLIAELAIGTAWGSGARERTVARLAAPIPDPKFLGLSPLRSKEWD